MRKFMDYHNTMSCLGTTTAQLSSGSGAIASTALNMYGFGRARFAFVLGTPGAGGATFSASIYCGTSSLAILTPITSFAAAGAAGSGVLVVDTIISANASGTCNSWMCVSNASVGVTAWDVMGIVDLYNCYIHPPTPVSALQVITI